MLNYNKSGLVIIVLDVKNALEKKGYLVSMFDTKEDATNYLNTKINQRGVGFGGSVTLTEMGLFDVLSQHNTVYWHDAKSENMSVSEIRLAANRADIYISSVNGISKQGEIINIDNTGNRVGALSYGPSIVYLVIGKNKIANDFASAMDRARNVASVLNAKRLKRNTPCVIKGDKCYDCNSEERICRNLSVFWTKPVGIEYEVILINENLGY